MAEPRYEPSTCYGHIAAGVEGKVYVWGGLRGVNDVSHDGPDKAEIISSVDILDVKVSLTVISLIHYLWSYLVSENGRFLY